MPKFTVPIWREVITTEQVVRTYEAADKDEAHRLAREDASSFNSCCPDDVQEQGVVECGDWAVDYDGTKQDD